MRKRKFLNSDKDEGQNSEKKILVVIDSNSLIHRAFHALPPLTTKKGEVVGAVYGFLLVFLKALKDFHPEFIAAAFDLPVPTFRHQEFKEYKIKRPPTPEDLSRQIPKVKEILEAFNVPVFEKAGFEADDIIGTIAKMAIEQKTIPGIEIIIMSGDLDNLQLINSNTKVYTLKRGIKDVVLYDKALIKEKYQGLEPRQLLDYKALKGDPSDNIPGVPGIGEKTALQLIKDFTNIENLYAGIEKSSLKQYSQKYSQRIRDILIRAKDQAFFSKRLATIRRDVPIDFTLEICDWKGYDEQEVIKVLESLNFKSLIKRLPDPKRQNKEKIVVGDNLRIW